MSIFINLFGLQLLQGKEVEDFYFGMYLLTVPGSITVARCSHVGVRFYPLIRIIWLSLNDSLAYFSISTIDLFFLFYLTMASFFHLIIIYPAPCVY